MKTEMEARKRGILSAGLILGLLIVLGAWMPRTSPSTRENDSVVAVNNAPAHESTRPEREISPEKGAGDPGENEGEKATLGDLKHGWRSDSLFEIDAIRNETPAETLYDLADRMNTFYMVGNFTGNGTPGTRGNLMVLSLSRRFARLVAEFDPAPDAGQIAQVLDQLRSDTEKLSRMIEERGYRRTIVYEGKEYPGELLLEGDAVHRPSLEDQSDMPTPLGFRINVAGLLIARYSIAEGLPAYLDAFETAFELSSYSNETLMFRIVDRVIGDGDASNWTPEQQAIQSEYLAWFEGLPEVEPDGKPGLEREAMTWETRALPPWDSPARPGERAVSTGTPVAMDQEGTITVAFPTYKPAWNFRMDGGQAHRMNNLDMIWPDDRYGDWAAMMMDFARRFSEATRGATPAN